MPLVAAGLFGIVGVIVLVLSSANTSPAATGTYTDWFWPDSNYSSFQWQITPDNEQVGPDAYFYSHQFGFVNGDGGYSGMQGDINGKRLVFSVFGAGIAGDGPCRVESGGFDGGSGSGTSCLLPFDWVAGRTYGFNVSRDAAEANGTWWKAVVTDQSTGVSTQIARIKLPPAWGGLGNWSVVWIERYGGSTSSCSDIHYASASFTNFTANYGAAFPSGRSNHLADPPNCPGSLITDITNGVRHEVRKGNPVPPIIQAGTGTYLSDLATTYQTNGYGPVEKDSSNGGPAAGDGRIIVLNGQRYAKGLGIHTDADIRYLLGGRYSIFKANIGVDDEMGNSGSLVFQVWADGEKLYDSGLMTGVTATQTVNVDVTGRRELTLRATDGGDGTDFDHGDWADAHLVVDASLPQTAVVGGSTQFDDGTASRSVRTGTQIAAVANNAPRNLAYKLAVGQDGGNSARPCSANVTVINNLIRYPNSEGFIGNTGGITSQSEGRWQVCFWEAAAGYEGKTVTTPATLIIDNTPPVITNPGTNNRTSSSATVIWTTNEPSDSQVEYGPTTSYGTSTVLNTTLATNHSVSLTGLTPNTTYNYRVKSKDAAGNLAISPNATFITTAPTDTTPPNAPANLRTTSTSATKIDLAWNANPGSEGVVKYLIQRNGVNLQEATTTTYADSTVASNSTYTYKVFAIDAAGNTSPPSNTVSVTTPPALLGDINRDGRVNFDDALTVIRRWNQNDAEADLNGDNNVNFDDALLIIRNWKN